MSANSRAARIVIVDDQTAVREGLATMLDLLDDVTVRSEERRVGKECW